MDDDLDALVAVAGRVRQVDNYSSELPGGDLVRFYNRPEPIAAWVAVSDDAVIGHVALSLRTSRSAMQLVEAQPQERPAVWSESRPCRSATPHPSCCSHRSSNEHAAVIDGHTNTADSAKQPARSVATAPGLASPC